MTDVSEIQHESIGPAWQIILHSAVSIDVHGWTRLITHTFSLGVGLGLLDVARVFGAPRINRACAGIPRYAELEERLHASVPAHLANGFDVAVRGSGISAAGPWFVQIVVAVNTYADRSDRSAIYRCMVQQIEALETTIALMTHA